MLGVVIAAASLSDDTEDRLAEVAPDLYEKTNLASGGVLTRRRQNHNGHTLPELLLSVVEAMDVDIDQASARRLTRFGHRHSTPIAVVAEPRVG